MPEPFTQQPELKSNPAPALHETESDLIAATLAWAARRFGAQAARFLRPSANGGWRVITWMHDSISLHAADHAEIAMAWNVALGRQRLLVDRPRVSAPDGSGLRPIATRRYIGTPVICQDRILGIIEVAGDLRPDLETASLAAQPEFDRFALRLAFDPSLHPTPPLTLETSVQLSGGAWIDPHITLTPDDLRVVSPISGPTTLGTLTSASGLEPERVRDIVLALLRLGLLELAG